MHVNELASILLLQSFSGCFGQANLYEFMKSRADILAQPQFAGFASGMTVHPVVRACVCGR